MSKTHQLSVLYFDDEAACLDVFQLMFGESYRVRTAATVAEARRALVDEKFDIVVSDYVMPEISGAVFLSEVAATQPDAYRVLLTGAVGVGTVLHGISGGDIHLFHRKPWTEQNMRLVLELAAIS